jgi:hypothetical protein
LSGQPLKGSEEQEYSNSSETATGG